MTVAQVVLSPTGPAPQPPFSGGEDPLDTLARHPSRSSLIYRTAASILLWPSESFKQLARENEGARQAYVRLFEKIRRVVTPENEEQFVNELENEIRALREGRSFTKCTNLKERLILFIQNLYNRIFKNSSYHKTVKELELLSKIVSRLDEFGEEQIEQLRKEGRLGFGVYTLYCEAGLKARKVARLREHQRKLEESLAASRREREVADQTEREVPLASSVVTRSLELVKDVAATTAAPRLPTSPLVRALPVASLSRSSPTVPPRALVRRSVPGPLRPVPGVASRSPRSSHAVTPSAVPGAAPPRPSLLDPLRPVQGVKLAPRRRLGPFKRTESVASQPR